MIYQGGRCAPYLVGVNRLLVDLIYLYGPFLLILAPFDFMHPPRSFHLHRGLRTPDLRHLKNKYLFTNHYEVKGVDVTLRW